MLEEFKNFYEQHYKNLGLLNKLDGAYLSQILNNMAVDMKTNVLRGFGPTAINSRKNHCPHGHPYNDGNTLTYKRVVGRWCRKCKILVSRKIRLKNKIQKNTVYL